LNDVNGINMGTIQTSNSFEEFCVIIKKTSKTYSESTQWTLRMFHPYPKHPFPDYSARYAGVKLKMGLEICARFHYNIHEFALFNQN